MVHNVNGNYEEPCAVTLQARFWEGCIPRGMHLFDNYEVLTFFLRNQSVRTVGAPKCMLLRETVFTRAKFLNILYSIIDL